MLGFALQSLGAYEMIRRMIEHFLQDTYCTVNVQQMLPVFIGNFLINIVTILCVLHSTMATASPSGYRLPFLFPQSYFLSLSQLLLLGINSSRCCQVPLKNYFKKKYLIWFPVFILCFQDSFTLYAKIHESFSRLTAYCGQALYLMGR